MSAGSGEWISNTSMLLWVLAVVIGTVWGMAVGFELIGEATRHPRVAVFFWILVCLLAAFWISGRYDLYRYRRRQRR